MNLTAFSLALHVVAAVVWVGGMFLAHVCVRPAAVSVLEPPPRLTLWVNIFARFFPLVWLAVIFLPLTGYLMVFTLWAGFAHTPVYVHAMNGTGTVMILIFLYVYFTPYRRLREAVVTQNWPEGGKQLAVIRRLVGVNILLGLVTIVIATAGRYLG